MASDRVVAWAGGTITLLGVVMFLALAASRGWFGVPVRLVIGAIFGMALVGVALRLHARPGGRAGALALAATGIAALYLDVGTATARYDYVPDQLGLLLGFVVAGVGLALADRWRSALLACGALLGVGVLMPVLAGDDLPLLVALVLVPALAAAPVVIRRKWTSLASVAALFPVLYGSLAVFSVTLSNDRDRVPTLAAVVGVFVVGTVLALLGSNRLAPVPAAARLAAASVPVLAMATDYAGRRGALLAALVGLAALLGALPARLPLWARSHRLVRLTSAMVGAVALFEATTLALGGGALTGVLLGQALVLTMLAAITRRRAFLLVGGCYGLVGLARAVIADAPVAALLSFPAEPYLRLGQPDYPALLTGFALSVLVVLLAASTVLAAVRLGLARADRTSAWLWGSAGTIGLYGLSGAVLAAALLMVPRQAGFLGGHAVVTLCWTLPALLLLAQGVARPVLRVAGLALLASALAKLLLFDLVALDGLARVAAFVGAGLLMLVAGSHYARVVARASEAANRKDPERHSRV